MTYLSWDLDFHRVHRKGVTKSEAPIFTHSKLQNRQVTLVIRHSKEQPFRVGTLLTLHLRVGHICGTELLIQPLGVSVYNVGHAYRHLLRLWG